MLQNIIITASIIYQFSQGKPFGRRRRRREVNCSTNSENASSFIHIQRFITRIVSCILGNEKQWINRRRLRLTAKPVQSFRTRRHSHLRNSTPLAFKKLNPHCITNQTLIEDSINYLKPENSTASRRRIKLQILNRLFDPLKPLLNGQRRSQVPREASLDHQIAVVGVRYLADIDRRTVESHSSNNLGTRTIT